MDFKKALQNSHFYGQKENRKEQVQTEEDSFEIKKYFLMVKFTQFYHKLKVLGITCPVDIEKRR